MAEMTPQSPISNLQSPLIKSRPLDDWLLWLVALASLALCFLATIYPARQASREMPVEVFRS